MSDCRRCTKIRGDSWYPVLRFDESDDTLTTVKWTKEEETEGRGRNDHHGDGSCFTTRCNSDRGKSRVGESSGLKKCSSSETTKICITNRAESTDLCLNRGGGDALLFSDTDNDMLLSPSPPIHYCNCNYCSMEEDEEDSEVDLYSNDEGRKGMHHANWVRILNWIGSWSVKKSDFLRWTWTFRYLIHFFV